MFGAPKLGRFRSLASLILVVNVVGELQHLRHRAVSLRQHGFLVLSRGWFLSTHAESIILAVMADLLNQHC